VTVYEKPQSKYSGVYKKYTWAHKSTNKEPEWDLTK